MAQFSVPGLGWANTPAFQLGRGKTLAIPMELHASARHKICDILTRRGTSNGIVLLKGGQEQNQYDTDIELVFRYVTISHNFSGIMQNLIYKRHLI